MLVNADARKRIPNTTAASLVERKPAEGPAATVMTVASMVIRAKTSIHPSICEFSIPGRLSRVSHQTLSTCNAIVSYTFETAVYLSIDAPPSESQALFVQELLRYS